jgi:hypothetical protein
VAKPLSSDQTPYRKDERERVKACGARVMSMDQIEGLEPIHENWGDVNLGEELDEGGGKSCCTCSTLFGHALLRLLYTVFIRRLWS